MRQNKIWSLEVYDLKLQREWRRYERANSCTVDLWTMQELGMPILHSQKSKYNFMVGPPYSWFLLIHGFFPSSFTSTDSTKHRWCCTCSIYYWKTSVYNWAHEVQTYVNYEDLFMFGEFLFWLLNSLSQHSPQLRHRMRRMPCQFWIGN